jgi:hypothetical protein
MEFRSTALSLNSPSENGDDKEEEAVVIIEHVAQGGTNIMSKVKIGDVVECDTWYQEGSLRDC